MNQSNTSNKYDKLNISESFKEMAIERDRVENEINFILSSFRENYPDAIVYVKGLDVNKRWDKVNLILLRDVTPFTKIKNKYAATLEEYDNDKPKQDD